MKHLWLERSMNWFKGKGERRKMCLYLQISPNDQIDWDFRQVFPPFLGQPSLIFAPTALSLSLLRSAAEAKHCLGRDGHAPNFSFPKHKEGFIEKLFKHFRCRAWDGWTLLRVFEVENTCGSLIPSQLKKKPVKKPAFLQQRLVLTMARLGRSPRQEQKGGQTRGFSVGLATNPYFPLGFVQQLSNFK